MIAQILVALVTGYLLGNLNGAVSISSQLEHKDVREAGSGNAGLTNFLRNYGSRNAVLVVLIDLVKTVAACLVGGMLLKPFGYGMEGVMLGGVAVSLGHDFPATLGFRGGKGILCGAGIALVADWRICILILVVFGLFVLTTRYVSLGSIMACLAFGIGFTALHLDKPLTVAAAWLIALLAIFMHRENIRRLLQGNERKIGGKHT